MKSIARMALKPGMILGENIKDSTGKIVFKEKTELTAENIELMKRYSIMCVMILEDIDMAETHYERLHYDNNFRAFEICYTDTLNKFKGMLNQFLTQGTMIEDNKLLSLYSNLRSFTSTEANLLDYLYNLMPNEDLFTYSHLLNSALVAGVFADWLSINSQEKDMLILCAFYYDLGKLLLPPYLLWKTEKLTNEEFELMRNHTVLGFKAVMNTPLDSNIKRSMVMHHERMDGRGYPRGIKGNEIDFYSKMLAIIDTYEAMASPRTYRQSIHPLNIIHDFEQHYSDYDSNLLLPILKRLAESQIGAELRLNDQKVYEVLLLNKDSLSRPVIRDKEQNIINLAQRPDLTIQ